jgi:hypothetical protein
MACTVGRGYLTDEAREPRALLSAHLGPGLLYVVDVGTNSLVRVIPNVPGITGVEYIPALHHVYTSDWGEEKIAARQSQLDPLENDIRLGKDCVPANQFGSRGTGSGIERIGVWVHGRL